MSTPQNTQQNAQQASEQASQQASEYGPEFDEFAKRARENLVPMVEDSEIFISVTPKSPDKVDIKFALELGIAIMLDKPIIATLPPGAVIPEKLNRVVDKFVKVDLSNPSNGGIERLTDAINELSKTLNEKLGEDE